MEMPHGQPGWHTFCALELLTGKLKKKINVVYSFLKNRYLEAIKTAAIGTSQTLLQQQRDLCLLHLFNSFLESAPQLVLQLYVTASLGSLLPWTGKLYLL